MLSYLCIIKVIYLLCWMQISRTMSLLPSNPFLNFGSDSAGDITDFILAKGYIPNEKSLSRPSIVKNVDNDATYLLSKLSDEDLLNLLSNQPKKNEYDMKDLIKITMHPSNDNLLPHEEQTVANKRLPSANDLIENLKKTRFQTVSRKIKPKFQIGPENIEPSGAFFRLEHKEVNPFVTPKGIESQLSVVQKVNSLSPPEAEDDLTDDEDENKELLFDILVGQLKSLCCKRNKPKKSNKPEHKINTFMNYIVPKPSGSKNIAPEVKATESNLPHEHMFLILNEEIKASGNQEDSLISVDPESLGKNSSVMLLGPIATPLSDAQLKVVMTRIATELSRPEYLPLLQEISDGLLSDENRGLARSLVSGPQTRRYIKPHRCNHRSQLARIYGGPKWLICTGYLNLNTPSLYD